MSGVSSSSGASQQFGTNVPPVSFPGVASGIDYNAIISKLSALAFAPAQVYNAQIQKLTAQNAEMVRINGLLASVQNALTPLSQPSLFQAITVTSGNAAVLSATANPSAGVAAPGTYTIDSVQLGTQTTYSLNELQSGNGAALDPTKTLGDALTNLSITPTVPSATAGSFSLNGRLITYNLLSDTINSVVAQMATAPGITGASVNASGQVVLTSASQIAIGSAGDVGNLVHVLKLDTAIQVGGSLTSSASIAGVNLGASYNASNNAGFTSAITGGTLTINGVNIQVTPTQNLNNTISAINASAAGVVANYDAVSGIFTLANKAAGAQSISISDTSGLSAALGLNSAAPTVGTPSLVQFTDPSGAIRSVYSSTNNVTSVIPGVTLNLASNDPATPFTVSVAADSSQAVSAIGVFVSAYNAAIDEINGATVAPILVSSSNAGATTQQSQQAVGGGVLFGNPEVLAIKDRLVSLSTSIVSGGGGNNPNQYNSFSAVGLQLDSSFTVLTGNAQVGTNVNAQAGQTSGSQSSAVGQTTFSGTSGKFAALLLTTFNTAFAANPSQLASLFTGATSIIGTVGAYLTQVTGSPTSLGSGFAGTVPTVSLLQNFEDGNTSNIQSLQQQVALITDNVNLQANNMRAQFVSSEAQIGQLQSLQSQLGMLLTSFSGH